MTHYIRRSLETVIQTTSQHFRVILLTGPRQVGKTTLLEHVEPHYRSYVSFDDLNNRAAAEQDPAGFIERLELPVLLDEIQYVPTLFPYIKLKVDKLKQPGLFWLTGSQQFNMMQHITESLAGRVVILQLSGLSLAEQQQRPDSKPFLPVEHVIQERQAQRAQPLTQQQAYHLIWRGSYPDVVATDGQFWERFYESYVTTYIQRDVQDYLQVKNPMVFHQFMQIIAARTGQLLNYKDIARDVGVSEPTVKSWLSVLQASGIIELLPPYFNNHTKRMVKSPKLYFMDTGLCCYLTGWLTPTVLERGAMAGNLLETYVVCEIIKSYQHLGHKPRLYFYRDKDKNEIDLLIEHSGILYPIEIKKTASIHNLNLKPFDRLKHLKADIGRGGVICFVPSPLPLQNNIEAIPLGFV